MANGRKTSTEELTVHKIGIGENEDSKEQIGASLVAFPLNFEVE